MSEGPRTAEILRQTRPWVRFLSIMGFIGVSLMFAGGVVMAIGGAIADQNGLVYLGILYLFVAAIYVMPCVLLSRFASRIARYLAGGGGDALDSALEAQKSFWKLVGILTIVMLIIYALALVGFVVAELISAGQLSP